MRRIANLCAALVLLPLCVPMGCTEFDRAAQSEPKPRVTRVVPPLPEEVPLSKEQRPAISPSADEATLSSPGRLPRLSELVESREIDSSHPSGDASPTDAPPSRQEPLGGEEKPSVDLAAAPPGAANDEPYAEEAPSYSDFSRDGTLRGVNAAPPIEFEPPAEFRPPVDRTDSLVIVDPNLKPEDLEILDLVDEPVPQEPPTPPETPGETPEPVIDGADLEIDEAQLADEEPEAEESPAPRPAPEPWAEPRPVRPPSRPEPEAEPEIAQVPSPRPQPEPRARPREERPEGEPETQEPTDPRKVPHLSELVEMEKQAAEKNGTGATRRPTDVTPAGEPAVSDAQTAQPDHLPYIPWQQRRGPAYPNDFWRSFGRDAKELPATMWDDTVAVAKSPTSWILLAAAGTAGIAMNSNRGDNQVAEHFADKGNPLGHCWDQVGDVGGNPGLHFAVAGTMYFSSLARGDTKTYEVSKTMINALAINGLLTMGLKVATRTESPNGDEFGWPSGHTSSTFTMATVMHHSYGPWVGVPMFAFASFVGFERIAARNHDFTDVISGALIGMAIGHAVSKNHEPKIFGMTVLPYTDPRGGVGVALYKRW